MPFNCNFYCGYFDIYHSGLARPALFFVTVYIVEISTVAEVNIFLAGFVHLVPLCVAADLGKLKNTNY